MSPFLSLILVLGLIKVEGLYLLTYDKIYTISYLLLVDGNRNISFLQCFIATWSRLEYSGQLVYETFTSCLFLGRERACSLKEPLQTNPWQANYAICPDLGLRLVITTTSSLLRDLRDTDVTIGGAFRILLCQKLVASTDISLLPDSYFASTAANKYLHASFQRCLQWWFASYSGAFAQPQRWQLGFPCWGLDYWHPNVKELDLDCSSSNDSKRNQVDMSKSARTPGIRSKFSKASEHSACAVIWKGREEKAASQSIHRTSQCYIQSPVDQHSPSLVPSFIYSWQYFPSQLSPVKNMSWKLTQNSPSIQPWIVESFANLLGR